MPNHLSPPLVGLRVLEFAGLAPGNFPQCPPHILKQKQSNHQRIKPLGPFAGLLLADYGASVLRLDRATTTPHPTSDQLTRRKTSIRINIKSPAGVAIVKKLAREADILIDPFRPGVLEKAGLGPEDVLLKINPRLIVARMTGFRRDGNYKDMAGHDINYIAVSGVLSMFGRKGEKPYPPGNLMGDFAGGGAMCFLGILLALLAREKTGRGQVVEANMVDGSAILATMPRLGTKTAVWSAERGTNIGAIEPQFYAALLHGLQLKPSDLPGNRDNRADWPVLTSFFTRIFKSKTRAEWEAIFDGTDACCTPVLTQADLEQRGFDQRPAVTLRSTPGLAITEGGDERSAAEGQGIGWEGSGWVEKGLKPGEGGEETIQRWMGWRRGRHYDEVDGGLVWKDNAKL
ncbi:alpha-methylacyl-CoA racemase-like protein [Plenodomus tracheiphilus IPT5]|uniref:Alpha-methylacyl-CoA racemase-like protein n=1 Tax=Plenodomus tracheiphilus IPT5 TaxID=1408161 RepID=A0A6A7APD5_9PLEO|nr:alpha-methylacyl-CoA racemase-like protein [Plenodomus tracheiphilus IPT5]